MKRTTRTDASQKMRAQHTNRGNQVSPQAPASEGRLRVAIEHVEPELDGGRFPVKRVLGDTIIVEADLFADGHDVIRGLLRSRHESQEEWLETPLSLLGNDRWQASFQVTELGQYRYSIMGWVDHFATWQRDMRKRLSAQQDVTVDILIGKQLIETAISHASDPSRRRLKDIQAAVSRCDPRSQAELNLLLGEEAAEVMADCVDHRLSSSYDRELLVVVDRPKARFSAWYEMFPRSTTDEEQPHGTFKDCESRLSYIAEMGFDVLYLPPIHPIGETHRKGPNNNPRGDSASVGSPWAIGARNGGHRAIHSQLGSLEDFKQLLAVAREKGIEIALDLAFQCSPDHPYVQEHPEWFMTRPDGTIQFAENPPKQYQDIFPLNFETDAFPELWKELRGVVQYWIDHGIRIFRVDNPHTKPFLFWKWLIGDVKATYPETIFLAEAFTRPKVMYHLAKVGFTQSYTYFAWRNSKPELTDYFTELTTSPVREFFRPNLWTNTPDILTEHLQHGGRPVFMVRLALAATLGSSYGIYGPAFELYENRPQKPGSEEYLDSEKYEVRRWDITRPDSLKEFIGLINRIRRENPALQSDASLQFHPIDNDYLMAYSKQSPDGSNVILVVVNLSPHHVHAGWLELDLSALGIHANRPFQVHDLLTHAYYVWQGSRNYVQLDPHSVPVQIFAVRRNLRREQDFDYFL
ncbi:MAG: Alpha-1,4-glucan:maltose-1-phosphate maltosyltransferase [Nitrospira sp.]|nr:MAG: Alpha-1,4-glucan:maltose-1-phosphate maltosyltransferase [Nitrospira sp.]